MYESEIMKECLQEGEVYFFFPKGYLNPEPIRHRISLDHIYKLTGEEPKEFLHEWWSIDRKVYDSVSLNSKETMDFMKREAQWYQPYNSFMTYGHKDFVKAYQSRDFNSTEMWTPEEDALLNFTLMMEVYAKYPMFVVSMSRHLRKYLNSKMANGNQGSLKH